MNKHKFINSIKEVVVGGSVKAIESNLIFPHGRSPQQKLLELSNWYNSLDDSSKKMALKLVQEAVETSVFGFLCVLDGVSVIEEIGEKGTLQLVYISPKGESILLTDEDEYLHNIL